MRGWTGWLLVLVGLTLVAGCGRHRGTVYLPAEAKNKGPGYALGPVARGAPPASPAPSTSNTPATPPPAVVAELQVRVTGPGPQRIAADASEATVAAIELRNAGPAAVVLDGLTLRGHGRLDDARHVTTARLAEDVDGNGRFDRTVDRVLTSAGFTQDDGELPFQPSLGLQPNAQVRLLVTVDLNGAARANDDLQLRLVDPAQVRVSASGGVARVALRPGSGPVVRVGDWVEPHQAFHTQGDGLWPRAVRDAQGNTHVALYQNSGASNVWYTRFDGRAFSPVDQISHSPRTAWNPDLALDGQGSAHIAWEEWDATVNDFAIRYSRWDAHAFGWTAAEPVSNGTSMSLYARLIVVGGTVHVVWEDWSLNNLPRVLHRSRAAAGGWSGIADVSSAAAGAQAGSPVVAPQPNGELLVVWAENDSARSELRSRTLSSSGWGPVAVVTRTAQTVARPTLLFSGSETHLAFQTNGEVYHARRGTSGGWSQPVNVSRSPLASSSEAALAVHQGALHVVWIEDDPALSGTATQVAHARAQGGGFANPVVLTRGAGARSQPTVVSEGSRIRILWQDWSLGRQRIFTTWSEAGRLEAPRVVAAPGGEPSRPSAARDALGALQVVYGIDAGGNHEVFHAGEDRPGLGFATPVNVSQSSTPSYKPCVATVGSVVWAAWEEQAASGFQVRVARRDVSGWGTPATISSASPAYAPRLSAGPSGTLTAVWSERVAPNDHDLIVRSHDGTAWGPPRVVAPLAAGDAWNPDLTHTVDGDLLVVWEEEEPGRRRIRIATRSASGLDVAYVASSLKGQYAPRVACRGQETFVAWVEDGAVRVARRGAGAARFDAPTDLSSAGSWSVDVAVANGAVVVCWEQWTHSDARVMFSRQTAQGWTAAAPLDLARGPSKRISVLGTAAGGVGFLWTDPGRVVLRQRRED